MKLIVPNLIQEKDSTNCQAVTLQMVLHYFGDMVSIEEIMAGLNLYLVNKIGMHSEGPAIWAAQRGYKVTYRAHDLDVIDQSIGRITEANTQNLKDKLGELQESGNEYRRLKIKLDLDVIESGASYSTEITPLSFLDEMLKRKLPIIIGVRGKGLHMDPYRKGNHSIVVVGADDNGFIVNDPNPTNGAQYTIPRDELLMAWYINSARVLVIEKRV